MDNAFRHHTLKLVKRVKKGDQAALEQLCHTYNERILRIVRMRMGPELRSKMQSMDLVQDTFISAIRSMENFTYTNEGDFLRWISKIAENRLRDNIDKFHAGKRDIRKEIPLNNRAQDTYAPSFDPIDSTTPSLIMSKQEDLDKLEMAMDKLKPDYREVIKLTKIEGLSYKEVAEKLGKTPDATRMLLARAISALSHSFEELE